MTKLERIILKSKPITFVLHKSKQLILPGFYGVPLYDAFAFFFKQINKVGLNERAAAISFNFIMAIPAAAICIITLVPYLPFSNRFQAEIMALIAEFAPNRSIYNMAAGFIDDYFSKPKAGLLSFGFLLVIYYASNAMLGVIHTFDRSIYQYQKKSNFIIQRWRAVKLTMLVIFFIIGVIILLIGQGFVFEKMMSWLNVEGAGIVWAKILRWLVTISLFFFSISFIYKFGPSVNKRWRTITPGSILATFLIILTTVGFSFYVNNFSSYNKIYGSIGTVLVLMLLVDLNSLILLIGFELNVSITFLRAEAEERRQKELSTLIEKEVLTKLDK